MGPDCIPTPTAYAAGDASKQAKRAAAAAAAVCTVGWWQKVAKEPVMEDAKSVVPETHPVSQETLMSEVRYGIVFGEMNEVFNDIVSKLLATTCGVCAAMSAGGFVSLLKPSMGDKYLMLSIVIGVISIVAFAIRNSFKFDERAKEFRRAKAEFQELEGKGWSMNQNTLMKEVAKLRKSAPSGGSWLASAAFNKACAELGHPEVKRRVGPIVRFVAARVG